MRGEHVTELNTWLRGAISNSHGHPYHEKRSVHRASHSQGLARARGSSESELRGHPKEATRADYSARWSDFLGGDDHGHTREIESTM